MIKKSEELKDRDHISIQIASAEIMRSWSRGVVKKAETLNYRTLKPEKDGLFCEKIFGPVRDWECACGKYKGIKFKGIVCDRCGVMVTRSAVRREWMGHIELACPVTHIWFYKAVPSRLAALLQIGLRDLEKLIYYEEYVVIDPGETPLKPKQFLSEDEYQDALVKYGGAFKAKIGADAVREMFKDIDLDVLCKKLRKDLEKANPAGTNAKKIAKTLKIVEDFNASNNSPEWMVLDVLPVIPPDLRPLVPLEGGRFATSDLNDLYRRVINRNNRLKKLIDLNAPEIICRNEKRMLQEAVDALLDNGRHGRPVLGSGNRPLKSLSDMLKGKQGRFRMNLLGKRVDYSGRSVIVVGPNLKLHQCGLPKKMALELFEPFIIRKLREKGYVHTIKGAKRMVERAKAEVWDILDEVIQDHPIMLNRAPTLHRLSIQAFYPTLVEGKAIKLHPLVCSAFNADFDGDQMAVHVPLSLEAQMECRLELLSINNLFSPADGRPVVSPSQDMVLGLYYLTKEEPNAKDQDRIFSCADEVIIAHNDGMLGIHERIKIKLDRPVWGEEKPSLIISQVEALEAQEKVREIADDNKTPIIETTVGRVLFNQILPLQMGFVNELMDKKKIGSVISSCYKQFGQKETILLLDRLKDMGFANATLAGISISISDMTIPSQKADILKNSRQEVNKVQDQYRKGIITGRERYNKIIDVWTHTTEALSDLVFDQMDPFNPVFIMADSGARGSRLQIRQLSGMRGLMAKPSGEIIE
ncbi:MAG: DNA-directed RNA polymerase subunit beta', partial [Candidatus Omnitrophica bacterium]|nr:DNA-directed RNA polymerase subunit beta' [Candidatus Omnitrophota bacterium]